MKIQMEHLFHQEILHPMIAEANRSMALYSYVVKIDSGFAPNPFYNFCTLATCKPGIRKSAKIGDWIVGVGSSDKRVCQKGRIVYAMEVTKIISFQEYFEGKKYQCKKPIINGSRIQARGDNIYQKNGKCWDQLKSFHSSKEDWTPNRAHIRRDTSVNHVLISDNYTYFGKGGPIIHPDLKSGSKKLVKQGVGYNKFSSDKKGDAVMIMEFFMWYQELGKNGRVGYPFDWDEGRRTS